MGLGPPGVWGGPERRLPHSHFVPMSRAAAYVFPSPSSQSHQLFLTPSSLCPYAYWTNLPRPCCSSRPIPFPHWGRPPEWPSAKGELGGQLISCLDRNIPYSWAARQELEGSRVGCRCRMQKGSR